MHFKLLSSLIMLVNLTQAANSVVAHWSFDTLHADTFYNAAGNDYHVSSPGLKTDKGVLGNALLLSDTSFKPVIQNSSTSFLLSQFSIEAWVQLFEYPEVVNREYYQFKILEFSSIDPSLIADGFSLCIKEGGRPDITLGNENWIECTSPQSLQKNRWYHLTGTWDGQMLKLYINGKMVQKLAYSGQILAPEANATIGCQIRETSAVFCRFFGLIDELKLYNFALDSLTIVNDYAASNPYPADQPRLIAHWSFDTSSQGIYYDQTGNGFGALTSLKVTDGILGKSLLCDTSKFDIEIQNSVGNFELPNFTFEGWYYSEINLINPGSFNNFKKLFDYARVGMEGSGDGGGFGIHITDKGKLEFSLANPTKSPTWITVTSDSTLHPRQWYHVAATYDGSMARIYINGKLVKEKSHTLGYLPSNIPARIGCELQVTSGTTGHIRTRFVGKIDEVKLFNYALNSHSIDSIYTALKPVESSPFEINFGMKNISAKPGDTVIMPVFITNFEDFAVSACQFEMKFNSQKLGLLTVQKDSGIISDWPLFIWNPITADSISIAMAGTSTPINYGGGEFVRFIFKVLPTASINDTCTISLHNISIDETYNLVTATTKPGKVFINSDYILYGDVTGNSEVNIFDAQKVLSYVVGTLTLPDTTASNFTLAVADVSGNGSISSYDAALIFQHSVGLLPEFPVVQQGSKRLLQKRSVTVSSGAHLTAQIENIADNALRCTIIGSNLKGFVAGELSIGFDPSIVTPSRGSITTSIRGATLNSKIDATSRILKVAIITNDDIDENDPVQLLTITLPPTQVSTDGAFYIQSALLNEGKMPTNIMTTTTRPEDLQLKPINPNCMKVFIRGTDLTVNSSAVGSTTEIAIWSLNGKTIIYKIFNSHPSGSTLSLKQLAPGSYLYKIKLGNAVSKGKFVISY